MNSLFLFLLIGAVWNSSPAWAMAHRPPVDKPAPVERGTPSAPLSLEDCYELALKRSETVAIQKEDIKEAEAQFFIAASEALGDVHFVMDRTFQEDLKGGGDTSSTGRSSTDPDKRERRIVITQPLFQGFKALGALIGAGSLRKEQKEEWLRAQELLFLDVVQAYYGFLKEKKDLETIDGIYSLYKERVRELEEREAIGRSRTSEVITAKARMKTLEAERAHVRGTLSVSRSVLEFLTGIKWEGQTLSDEPVSEEPPQELYAYLTKVDERSDVEGARQAVKTAKQGILVAQSQFWPELSIENNQYIRREGLQSNIDWDLLFKIDVPLFQGGEAIGNVKKAVSGWKKKKLNYSKVRREAELEIKKHYENWLASVSEARSLGEAVKASEENFRLQKEDYSHNLVSNLDVLEALQELLQTRRDANRAHYEMKQHYWAFQVSTGDLDGLAPSLRASRSEAKQSQKRQIASAIPGALPRNDAAREPRFP